MILGHGRKDGAERSLRVLGTFTKGKKFDFGLREGIRLSVT